MSVSVNRVERTCYNARATQRPRERKDFISEEADMSKGTSMKKEKKKPKQKK